MKPTVWETVDLSKDIIGHLETYGFIWYFEEKKSYTHIPKL